MAWSLSRLEHLNEIQWSWVQIPLRSTFLYVTLGWSWYFYHSYGCKNYVLNFKKLQKLSVTKTYSVGWIGMVFSVSVKKWPKPSPIRVPPPNFYILPIKALLSPLLLEMGHSSLKTKKGHWNFQQQNESIFLGNICCSFLQELTIHDHESLLQAENF